MDPERKDDNIYDLITQLIRHMLQQNRLENENSYVPPRSDVKIVKSLRSKAYEILLNKSNKICHRKKGIFTFIFLITCFGYSMELKEKYSYLYSTLSARFTIVDNAAGSEIDPLVEILKHIFVLKLALRRLSEAEELEKLINELYTKEDSTETTYHPILQLLVELKSFQINRRVALVLIFLIFSSKQLIFCTFVDESVNVIVVPQDVFHYGKNNPSLPEDVTLTKGVPIFQTYPMESFNFPEKFEAMLGIRRSYTKKNTPPNFVSGIPFKDQYVSRAILGIETIRYMVIFFCQVCLSCGIP